MRRPFQGIVIALVVGLGASSCTLFPGSSEAKARRGLTQLRGVFLGDRFVAYAPSTFDPLRLPFVKVSEAGIAADLAVVRPYFSGLVTYSCDPRSGMDRIVPAADRMNFKVIVGVWDVTSAEELDSAMRLAAAYP